MASADHWRWTDEDGVQRLLSADELRAAILEGRLKPSTLVWKRGMKSWAPAESVPELMEAIEKSQGAWIPPSLGPKAPRSSSIPDPVTGDELTNRKLSAPPPANLVNIAALRAQQKTGTLMGHRSDQPPESTTTRQASGMGIVIPAAPKVPSFTGASGYTSGKPPAAASTPGKTNLDGLWADAAGGGARPRRDLEETVTKNVPRDEEERTNVAPKPKASRGKKASSAPPPPKRNSSAPVNPSNAPPRTPPPPPPKSRRNLARNNPKTATTLVSEADEAGDRAAEARNNAIRLTQALGTRAEPAVAAAARPPTPHTLQSEEQPRGPNTAPFPQRNEIPAAPPIPAQPWSGAPPTPTLASPSDGELEALSQRPASGFLVDAAEPMSRAPATPFSQRASRMPPPASSKRLVAIMAGVGAVLLIAAFVIGRVSSSGSPRAAAERARAGWASVPLFARSRARMPEPRPCLMASAPTRWSYQATRSIPFELVPTPDGKLAIGYGRSGEEPRGLVLDPNSSVIVSNHEPEEKIENLARVVPIPGPDGVKFVSLKSEQDGVKGALYLRAEKPMLIGVAGEELVMIPEAGAQPKALWKLPGPIDRLQVAAFGQGARLGFGVVYLSGDKVWFGAAKSDGSLLREPAALESAAKVGKPMIASDGREVSVVYAEGTPGETPIQIRWARVAIGQPLEKAPVLELPPGGPGGDAIAPDVAAVSGGRWLLLWTEGKEGVRALRAQTYDRRGRRLGDALRVSPETGNFGQGTVTLVGDTVAVAFLLKTESAYQLWGTVLQCR